MRQDSFPGTGSEGPDWFHVTSNDNRKPQTRYPVVPAAGGHGAYAPLDGRKIDGFRIHVHLGCLAKTTRVGN
jgi:hypothetical protein